MNRVLAAKAFAQAKEPDFQHIASFVEWRALWGLAFIWSLYSFAGSH